ncbi:hypothetical protein IPH25_01695 [bacterium]|nr:MAG: hypothetical protein IPG37_03825 [bacterium]QQR62139.1 MAG: hypothetical protein IPH25_01695 [bacterium]QQR63304.1 MAG: hypothetical protein IPH67_02415 [bacterium]
MAFAEIISSSLVSFTAQCWDWERVPQFGQCVVVDGFASKTKIYGVVYQINTGSADGQREAQAFGKTYAELRQQQPQIFHFLKITFYCTPIGYSTDNVYSVEALTFPAMIHAFVGFANSDQKEKLFSDFAFLDQLFTVQNLTIPIEDLLLAVLKSNCNVTAEYALRLLERYTSFVDNDYIKIRNFSKKLQTVSKL